MEAGGVLAVAVVAAPVEDSGGGSRSRDELQNVLVAGREVGVGEFHLAKAVVLVGVGASDPKNEVGGEVGKSRREGGFELLKVVGAADVTGEFDVEGAGSFYGRVVFPDVNRVGKDAGIGGEDGMGAVALVGISIEDEDAELGARGVQIADGDGDVVEDAVALAVVGERVMRTAGEVAGEAIGEGGVGRGESARDFEPRAGEQRLAGGQAEFQRRAWVERAGANLLEVVSRVDAEHKVERRGVDGMDRKGRTETFVI